MADVPSSEDAALRYVLGEFDDAEQREFESHLAASAELRVLVNELETGVVAMANAAPRRRAPAEIWRRIERTMAKETRPKLAFPSFGFDWLRNGWAVAVACLIGWLFYAFCVNRHLASAPKKSIISRSEVTVANLVEPLPKPVAAKTGASNTTNATFELLQARTREIMELRGKIAQLETAKTQLSRILAQQHALLGESNRIKFYQLATASTPGGNASTAPLSPGLQHAVFMALAREMGWLATDSPSTPQTGGNAPPMSATVGGVDFIELHPGSQSVVSQPQPQPPSESGQPTADNNAATTTQTQPQAQPQTKSAAVAQGTTASDPTIPAYVSGDNLVVAMDQTVVPAGSSVSLSVLDANQNVLGGSFVGSFILGNNPAVVTMPLNSPIYTTSGDFTAGNSPIGDPAGGLSFVIMSFQTPDGQTSTIQFYAPPTTNP
jgi:hypothetical protein